MCICKGPNTVGFVGLFQPFSDAIKLFSREQYFPFVSNYLSHYFSPVLELILSLLVWVLVPYLRGFVSFVLGLLSFLCCTNLGVYTVMVAGCLLILIIPYWVAFILWFSLLLMRLVQL